MGWFAGPLAAAIELLTLLRSTMPNPLRRRKKSSASGFHYGKNSFEVPGKSIRLVPLLALHFTMRQIVTLYRFASPPPQERR
jgi:hypothetical protein